MVTTHLHIPDVVWTRIKPDTHHADEVHAPHRDTGEADGGSNEQQVVPPTSRRCPPTEQQEGGVRAKERHDDRGNQDTRIWVDRDRLDGVVCDEPLWVCEASVACHGRPSVGSRLTVPQIFGGQDHRGLLGLPKFTSNEEGTCRDSPGGGTKQKDASVC